MSMGKKVKYRLFLLFRRVAYFIAPLLEMVLHTKNNVVVFCYHSVSHSGWRFSVTPETFKQQINYLLTKYEPITVGDLYEYVLGKKVITKPSFVLSFDDGYADILSVKEYLAEKRITPVAFILSRPDQPNRAEMDNNLQLLSESQVQELRDAGWDIGSHSATHSDFYALTEQEQVREIIESKSILETGLSAEVPWFAYPKGSYTAEVLAKAREAGYKLAFSMDAGAIDQTIDPVLVPRVGIEVNHTFNDFKLASSGAIIAIRKHFSGLLSKLA